MPATKADILNKLQNEIFLLQGFKNNLSLAPLDMGLGPIKNAFPGNRFPLSAIHEFIFKETEDAAVTCGFIAGLLVSLMHNGSATLWVAPSHQIFPQALLSFGISPDKIIFINLNKEKEMLWVMEEALKCDGLAAVVGEINDLSFTASRRLQLAVEKSNVTGFIIRNNTSNINTTACIARWKINALPSDLEDDMPGVGFPKWNVKLLKVRNGRPGEWQIEYNNGRFRHINKLVLLSQQQKMKTG